MTRAPVFRVVPDDPGLCRLSAETYDGRRLCPGYLDTCGARQRRDRWPCGVHPKGLLIALCRVDVVGIGMPVESARDVASSTGSRGDEREARKNTTLCPSRSAPRSQHRAIATSLGCQPIGAMTAPLDMQAPIPVYTLPLATTPIPPSAGGTCGTCGGYQISGPMITHDPRQPVSLRTYPTVTCTSWPHLFKAPRSNKSSERKHCHPQNAVAIGTLNG